MYAFYKDSSLTRPVTSDAPKWLLASPQGATKTTTLWIGDTYSAQLMEDAAPGATSLTLDQTAEFPAAGSVHATIPGLGFPVNLVYSSKTDTTLEGIPASGTGSISHALTAGLKLRPSKTLNNIALVVTPTGGDVRGTTPNIRVSLRPGGNGVFGIPGTPLLLPPQTIVSDGAAIPIDVRVAVPAGERTEFRDWQIQATGIPGNPLTAACGVFRADQGLRQQLRVMAPSRKISESLPGFTFGDHRWRDQAQMNARVLIPTQWDMTPEDIGVEKFVPGIGGDVDLELDSLEKADDGYSIHPRVERGHYFTGPHGFYLPATSRIELLQGSAAAGLTYTLADSPRSQTPVFVGRWRLDQYGYYGHDVEYRYLGNQFDRGKQFDPDDSGYQFTLDRAGRTLTINKALDEAPVFLGVASAGEVDNFDLPFYPTHLVSRVYADNPEQDLSFLFDRDMGTLAISMPPSGAFAGRALFAVCEPGLAVQYEVGSDNSRLVSEIDVNPAFAGIGHGHLYIQHRRWRPTSLQLFADKQRLTVPPSKAGDASLIAFGPVFYEQDYCLLLVKAFGNSETDLVPNVRLTVEVDPDEFEGTINYQDPASSTVEIVTGGDGAASLIYLPPSGFGQWLDPTVSRVADNKLRLNEPVDIAQLRNDADGWLVLTYSVHDDDAYLGKVGADVSTGETPWLTHGTAGQAGYRTNGRRFLLKDASNNRIYPTQALDAAGRNYDDALFSGQAVTLVYTDALPSDSNIGAYFVSFIGRVTIALSAPDYGIRSNSILLELAAPEEIAEQNPDGSVSIPTISGYLILDDDNSGRLGMNRLAGAPLPQIGFNTPRI